MNEKLLQNLHICVYRIIIKKRMEKNYFLFATYYRCLQLYGILMVKIALRNTYKTPLFTVYII